MLYIHIYFKRVYMNVYISLYISCFVPLWFPWDLSSKNLPHFISWFISQTVKQNVTNDLSSGCHWTNEALCILWYNAIIFCIGGPLNPKHLTCNPNIMYGGCSLYSLQYIIYVMLLTLCQVIVCQKQRPSAHALHKHTSIVMKAGHWFNVTP